MKITTTKTLKHSKFYEFTPCKGTLVNAGFDENKKQIQKQINHRVQKAERKISSTKLGNDNSLKVKTIRKGRYQSQRITTDVFLRISEIDRPLNFDRLYKFKPVKRI